MKRRTSLSESVELGANLGHSRPKRPPPRPSAKIGRPGPPGRPLPLLPRVQHSVDSHTVTESVSSPSILQDRASAAVVAASEDSSSRGTPDPSSDIDSSHKNKCCGVKLSLFKQTNACGCMRYVMAVAQFTLLFFLLLFETLITIITFILTLGCYYYESPWYWYTIIDRSYVRSGVYPASLITTTNIGSDNNNTNQKSEQLRSDGKSSAPQRGRTLRVLSQNLWCHYLAPAPIKTRRMRAFVEWLRTINENVETAVDVLLIQELFAVRFGPFIRGKHLVRVTVELHKLGYVEHSPIFGVIPWFGQNGGVIVFNRPSSSGGHLTHSRCVRYNQSDEMMLRKGYAISTLAYPRQSGLPSVVLATGHADPYRVEVMLSQYGDVAWGAHAQKSLFSGWNKNNSNHDQTTYEDRLIQNINNKLEESPHQWRQYTTSNDDSAVDPGSPPSMTLSSEPQHSPQFLSRTQDSLISGSGVTTNMTKNNSNNHKPMTQKGGYFLGVSANQVSVSEDASPSRSIGQSSTRVIIAGDWNTRNIDLMNGLPQIFQDSIPGIQDCFTILYEKHQQYLKSIGKAGLTNGSVAIDGGGSSMQGDRLTLIDIPSANGSNELREDGGAAAAVTAPSQSGSDQMTQSTTTMDQIEELPCTYRSRYLSKSEILCSLFFCQPLPSLIGMNYQGHCLDHVFTDVPPSRVIQAEVVDSRDGDVFVSDHLGVVVSVELGSH